MEAIVDASGIAARVEARLPIGVRPRQLRVRTLVIGMLPAARDDRPAHLTRVLAALQALPEPDRRRLGVLADWPAGPHELSYRQLEYTFARVVAALAKDKPDGSPSEPLAHVLDALLEASVTLFGEPASSSYAVDWTDHETWSRPPPKQPAAPADAQPADTDAQPADAPADHQPAHERRRRADREAAWGHRRGDAPGAKDEAFYGYYTQVVTIVNDEHGPAVPELVRRIQIASCDHDPPAALVPVIERMHTSGIQIGDLLADSGYAYRVPETWALPLRRLGVELIQDLHPNDRGPNGTHMGAIRANGNLYCPATPAPLLQLGPLAAGARQDQIAAHDRKTHERSKYKLAPISGYDPDGYRRVSCPAVQGKLRCPLRPQSLTLAHDHPEVLQAPEHPPACCQQKTLTVPPAVNAKTAQKHDYPSAAHRRSYARRTAAERAYATVKDPAATDLSRGWCRLTGLAPIALFTATAFIARNLRVADSFAARQADNQRRTAAGLPPKQRKRRRRTAADLIAAAHAPP